MNSDEDLKVDDFRKGLLFGFTSIEQFDDIVKFQFSKPGICYLKTFKQGANMNIVKLLTRGISMGLWVFYLSYQVAHYPSHHHPKHDSSIQDKIAMAFRHPQHS